MRIKILMSALKLTLFFQLLVCFGFIGCKEDGKTAGTAGLNASLLTKQEAETIENEIGARVDQYIEAVKALDSSAMLDFWSESPDFVYAGDGRVLGGSDKWKARMLDFVRTTSRTLYWNNENIHIKALSANAASYTMDFKVGFVNRQGDTIHNEGAWTYVFEKTGGRWKVIQTNGTH